LVIVDEPLLLLVEPPLAELDEEEEEEEDVSLEPEAPEPAASPASFGAVSQAAKKATIAKSAKIRLIIGFTPDVSPETPAIAILGLN
jgi:hypothetical protein